MTKIITDATQKHLGAGFKAQDMIKEIMADDEYYKDETLDSWLEELH